MNPVDRLQFEIPGHPAAHPSRMTMDGINTLKFYRIIQRKIKMFRRMMPAIPGGGGSHAVSWTQTVMPLAAIKRGIKRRKTATIRFCLLVRSSRATTTSFFPIKTW